MKTNWWLHIRWHSTCTSPSTSRCRCVNTNVTMMRTTEQTVDRYLVSETNTCSCIVRELSADPDVWTSTILSATASRVVSTTSHTLLSLHTPHQLLHFVHDSTHCCEYSEHWTTTGLLTNFHGVKLFWWQNHEMRTDSGPQNKFLEFFQNYVYPYYALQVAVFDLFLSNLVSHICFCNPLDKFVGQENQIIFTPVLGELPSKS